MGKIRKMPNWELWCPVSPNPYTSYKEELSYRKQSASQMHTQYVDAIYRSNYPWPWNLGQGSLEITGNGTSGCIIHDLLLVELFDVEYYRDLEMRVRGHSRSLKMVSFIWKLGYGFLFTFHSNDGRIFIHFGEFSVKERPACEIWVWGCSRSLTMAPFDRP